MRCYGGGRSGGRIPLLILSLAPRSYLSCRTLAITAVPSRPAAALFIILMRSPAVGIGLCVPAEKALLLMSVFDLRASFYYQQVIFQMAQHTHGPCV